MSTGVQHDSSVTATTAPRRSKRTATTTPTPVAPPAAKRARRAAVDDQLEIEVDEYQSSEPPEQSDEQPTDSTDHHQQHHQPPTKTTNTRTAKQYVHKPPKPFTGENNERDYESFRSELHTFLRQFGNISQADQVNHALPCFTREAATLLESRPIRSLEDIDNLMRSVFVHKVDPLSKLHTCLQLPTESTPLFAQRIKLLLIEKAKFNRTLVSLTADSLDTETLAYVRLNARRDIKSILQTACTEKLEDALACAVRYEDQLPNSPANTAAKNAILSPEMQKLHEKLNQIQKAQDHISSKAAAFEKASIAAAAATAPVSAPPAATGTEAIIAAVMDRLQEQGYGHKPHQQPHNHHYHRQPYQPQRHTYRNWQPSHRHQQNRGPPRCFTCGQQGHIARDCRSKNGYRRSSGAPRD